MATTRLTDRHPWRGERWLKVYRDGAWAGLAASVVLATSYVLGQVWGSYDSADVAERAVVRGVIGLGLGPLFSLISARLRIGTLVVAGSAFAVLVGLLLGQTSAREAIPALLYGVTLGLVLRHLRRPSSRPHMPHEAPPLR